MVNEISVWCTDGDVHQIIENVGLTLQLDSGLKYKLCEKDSRNVES